MISQVLVTLWRRSTLFFLSFSFIYLFIYLVLLWISIWSISHFSLARTRILFHTRDSVVQVVCLAQSNVRDGCWTFSILDRREEKRKEKNWFYSASNLLIRVGFFLVYLFFLFFESLSQYFFLFCIYLTGFQIRQLLSNLFDYYSVSFLNWSLLDSILSVIWIVNVILPHFLFQLRRE